MCKVIEEGSLKISFKLVIDDTFLLGDWAGNYDNLDKLYREIAIFVDDPQLVIVGSGWRSFARIKERIKFQRNRGAKSRSWRF